jgi:hypothetical protein
MVRRSFYIRLPGRFQPNFQFPRRSSACHIEDKSLTSGYFFTCPEPQKENFAWTAVVHPSLPQFPA